ncbi:uncharacterized protein LOC132732933 [Ruditapes philippinarum]|uniref:uncharacterized protein LOC132732933 n=1 Tax=Ruditapes philippinarum TaxID=129788 RepID=UPI00295AF173|nr:uncharacterized protein LOC132732933 [Ruditapes philippinarum]
MSIMACRNSLLAACLIGYMCSITTTHITFNDEPSIYSQLNWTCPADKPFMIKTGNWSICVSSCGPKMVADGKNCIKVEDCNKPVLSDGYCIEMCDEGYLYVTFDQDLGQDCGTEYADCSYGEENIEQKLCVKKSFLILKLVCYVIGTILYIAFLLMFFSTWQFPCIKLIMWIKSRNQLQKTSSREILCNDDVTDD